MTAKGPKPPTDDEALMRAYQMGDSAAFEALYQRNAGRVYGYLKPRLKRPEERDEVFQQIFLKLHRTRAQYLSKYSFSQWLFVISKSVLLDFLKSKRRSPADQATAGVEEIDLISVSQNQGVASYTETGGMEALDSLSDQERQIVSWRVLDELSYHEIASQLDRTEASVRQILSRALRKLRSAAQLKKSDEE